MGKGFDTFMENPYYRELYENAPSQELKRYYELTWDRSPFVMGADYEGKKEAEYAVCKGHSWTLDYGGDTSTGGDNILFLCIDDELVLRLLYGRSVH